MTHINLYYETTEPASPDGIGTADYDVHAHVQN